MDFTNKFDFTLSFTETAADDANGVFDYFAEKYAVYHYKYSLDEQNGFLIESLAARLYSEFPCILLVTSDWYTRAATILEMKHLRNNDHFKVVVDYDGNFETKQNIHCLNHFVVAPFCEDETIDFKGLERIVNRKMDAGY